LLAGFARDTFWPGLLKIPFPWLEVRMRWLLCLQVLGLLLISTGCARSRVEYQEIFSNQRVRVLLAEEWEKSGKVVPKGYDHPWNVDILTLENMLESVHYKRGRAVFGGGKPEEAFHSRSRHLLLNPIQKAFAQASPDQAVDFSFIEYRSAMKVFRRVYLTDGLMFRKGGKLNIAFRNLGYEELGGAEEEEPNREDPTASPIRANWTLIAGDGQALAKGQGSGMLGSKPYPNWVELDISWPWGASDEEIIEAAMPGMGEALESIVESELEIPQPTTPSREEVQERMEFLEELRREGSISEDSYREKKRELDLLYESLPD
jgi:hypothetical protein